MSLRRSAGRSRRTTLSALIASSLAIATMGAVTGAPTADGATPGKAGSPAAKASDEKGTTREAFGNYDSRYSNQKAVTRARAEVLRHQGAAIDRFSERLGASGVFSVNPLTGTPDSVARRDGMLTGPSSRPAKDVALGYVRANLQAFGLDVTDLATLSPRPKVVTDINGITHISWIQSVDGLPVFGNGLRAHVAKNGSLISVQGAPVSGLASLAAKAPESSVTASTARATAVANVRGTVARANVRSSGSETRWSNGDVARPVYFVTPGGLRSAWLTYTRSGAGRAYQHVIDASSGSTLYRHRTVNDDRGDALVVDNYPGARHGGTQKTVNLFRSGYLSRNATWLDGRYVVAWADINDDNEAQAREKTSVPGTTSGAQFKLKAFQDVSDLCSARYVCTWNPDKAFSWRVNKNQDGAQGFYFASVFHDYLKAAPIGFTPQMGNFEANGGDPVLLQVLDGATTDAGLPDGDHIDNANMDTPPDGVPPTMQMYLNHVPGTTAAEDPYLPASSSDAADNIFHEYTHGLSNRLVVDAMGNSTLNSLQSGAMGEAWSDYYAMDLIVTKGMLRDTAKSGEVLFDRYLTNNNAITRSEAIDCAVDEGARLCQTWVHGEPGGYTFGDLGGETGGPEVHADGEIWSQTLWDLRTALGHDTTARLVTEAMSLSPADPSFLDERDAILAADQAVYGGSRNAKIWKVFAGRGMGWFASATDASDSDVVEDFHTPPPPETSRNTLFGVVTDAGTGDPLPGAVVFVPGHSANYSDVTDDQGRYQIDGVLAGEYPELVAQAPAYDVGTVPVDVSDGNARQDFELRRDWAAQVGGADVADFNGPDFGPGCGPADAIDLSYGEGWSTPMESPSGDPRTMDSPRFITVKLPQPINVSAFGVNPSNTCGDAGSASTGKYRIEVSTDGTEFTQVEQGAFTSANRGRVNEIPVGNLPGVEYVKFWIDGSQVPAGVNCNTTTDAYSGCSFVDLTELEVYGLAGAAESKDVQILSFNDFHGHLEATDTPQAPLPAGTPPVGGVEYLSAKVKALRANQPDSTLTVAAGDLIGGSTFLSGLFQDQPSVEAMNELGLDVSSVGNHEFDEGTDELLRMVNGGCQPAPKGCFKDSNGDDIPYGGTDFDYLAANVVKQSDGEPLLSATSVKTVSGVKVGFIGMTLEATPSLVSPGGVATVDFLDEVETANAQVAGLKAQGVESIVVLLHEGGYQSGTYNECVGISDPILAIAENLDPEIDMVVTGHTHQPYICNVPDPAGQPRMVTSAASWGQVLTETHLKIDVATRDVVRDQVTSANRLVTRDIAKDPAQTAIIEFWQALSAPLAARVVGTLAPSTDITGDSSTCRCEETPMVDLVADAILWGTDGPADGNAQIALMNTGGVRNSFRYNTITNGEQPGEITYAETYNVAPFNNILVTVDMTGAQIEAVLNQQYQRITARGSRPMLSLGVSDGLTYEWEWRDAGGSVVTKPANVQPSVGWTGHVVPGSMELNGVPIGSGTTYRVATLNFLVEGGDSFTVFSQGTNKVGANEDLANLADYLTAHPGITPPADRVTGL